MKLNYDTVLVGERCLLVPYRPEHVERYHSWMQDPDLLEATGSEPLSLREEYEMQASWRDDDAKCTFIVLARHLLQESVEAEVKKGDDDSILANNFIQRSLGAMVGDVNLFLSEEEVDEGDDHHNEQSTHESNQKQPQRQVVTKSPHTRQAELDIMVAEKSCRGKGVGREASCLMMLYGATHLSIRRFFCKINEDNEASLGLFRHKLDFRQCDYAACFQQYELELKEESPNSMTERLTTLLGSDFAGLRTIQLDK